MTKIFVASDTHFGHRNIIKYCSRPFSTVGAMNETLVRTWNARVGPDDTVYFLGDFAMGPGVTDEVIVAMLHRLNGTMKVVEGNHDQPSRKYGVSGLAALASRFRNMEILSQLFELHHEGKTFVMGHYPMEDWDGKFRGSIHLHGHTHSRLLPRGAALAESQAKTLRRYPNQRITESHLAIINNRYDIGVDTYGGPVELTGDLRFILSPGGWDEA
jgi:calcineurin-like phosphoesterase family protein